MLAAICARSSWLAMARRLSTGTPGNAVVEFATRLRARPSGCRMIYLKSLAFGLLAAVATAVVQAVAFSRYESFEDEGGGFAGGGTDIYAAPVVIAAAAGSLAAWWRLRRADAAAAPPRGNWKDRL